MISLKWSVSHNYINFNLVKMELQRKWFWAKDQQFLLFCFLPSGRSLPRLLLVCSSFFCLRRSCPPGTKQRRSFWTPSVMNEAITKWPPLLLDKWTALSGGGGSALRSLINQSADAALAGVQVFADILRLIHNTLLMWKSVFLYLTPENTPIPLETELKLFDCKSAGCRLTVGLLVQSPASPVNVLKWLWTKHFREENERRKKMSPLTVL